MANSNGVDFLLKKHRELVDAEYALNPDSGQVHTDKPLSIEFEATEKLYADYQIMATNAGGHSSIPIRDNAIYQLADALTKVRDYEFPLKLSATTRAFFAKAGAARDDELGGAMVALSQNPQDAAAEAIVSKDRSYHSMLRTTCVATMLAAGHATNALPQRATANINCRIFPGVSRNASLVAG